jgi:hypothetical protein
MAIFGNLTEFPLIEVIGMLERRCGVLRFTQVGRFQSLELQLNLGRLQGLLVNGQVLRDGLAAKDLLVEIANQRQGTFEFQRVPIDSGLLLNDLSIEITEVLLRRATLDDEWNNFKENLPEPETRFVLATQELVWLEDDLQRFWNQAELLLEYGISTKELAERLSLDLRLVQVNLYKLRAIGVIRPARRVQEVADMRAGNFPSRVVEPILKVAVPDPKAALPEVKEIRPKPSLVSRLLGALRLIGKPL